MMKKTFYSVICLIMSFALAFAALSGCEKGQEAEKEPDESSLTSVSESLESEVSSSGAQGSAIESGSTENDSSENEEPDDDEVGPIDVDSDMKPYAKSVTKKRDKDFKVLYLTDIQLHDGEDPTITLSVIDQLVEKEQPDLIIHLGDLINDSRYYESKVNYVAVLDKIDGYGIPWAAIMGNHDYETYSAGYDSMKKTTTSDMLIDKFMSYDNCLFTRGPANVTGKSNYIINIMDEKTHRPVHSLYLMDSCLIGLQDSHAAFYRDAVEYSTLLNNGKKVESTLLTHVPLPEYAVAIEQAQKVEYRNMVGSYNRNPGDLASGSKKVFQAIKELGVTKNVICGHDHDNAYYSVYEGVRLAYSMKSSDGDDYHNPAQIGGSVLKIGKETEFYYTKADIQFGTDNDLSFGLDLLPYWRYSGAKLKFDIEFSGVSGNVRFALCGTNVLRYNVDEKYKLGGWNRLSEYINIDVANKSSSRGTLTKNGNGDKYTFELDLTDVPLNKVSGEVACGEETLRLIYFAGGSETNVFKISNVRYETEQIADTEKEDLGDAVVVPIEDQYYQFGQFVRPQVTASLNGQTLKAVDDILVIYENNTEIGSATVRIVPSGKGAKRLKGERVINFDILQDPNGDTIPGHENAAVVDGASHQLYAEITPVNDWHRSNYYFYFEIKKVDKGTQGGGNTFKFSLLGKNSNPDNHAGPNSDWNRLTDYYVLEFTDNSVKVCQKGTNENIAVVTDLGDKWFGVAIPYSALVVNYAEGALGNEKETFTLCYISDITTSFRLDNVDSVKTIGG